MEPRDSAGFYFQSARIRHWQIFKTFGASHFGYSEYQMMEPQILSRSRTKHRIFSDKSFLRNWYKRAPKSYNDQTKRHFQQNIDAGCYCQTQGFSLACGREIWQSSLAFIRFFSFVPKQSFRTEYYGPFIKNDSR